MRRSFERNPKNVSCPCGLYWVRPDNSYDPEQLAMGKKVELEHTPEPETAKCIAKHHLDEQIDKNEPQDYYTKLRTIHKD